MDERLLAEGSWHHDRETREHGKRGLALNASRLRQTTRMAHTGITYVCNKPLQKIVAYNNKHLLSPFLWVGSSGTVVLLMSLMRVQLRPHRPKACLGLEDCLPRWLTPKAVVWGLSLLHMRLFLGLLLCPPSAAGDLFWIK